MITLLEVGSVLIMAVALAVFVDVVKKLRDMYRDGLFDGVVDAILATAIGALAFRWEGSQTQLVRPPGYWITQLLGRWLSRSLIAKTFGQTIADARAEYNEALAAGEHEEARRIKRELNFALIRTIIELIGGLPADILVSAVKKVFKKEE